MYRGRVQDVRLPDNSPRPGLDPETTRRQLGPDRQGVTGNEAAKVFGGEATPTEGNAMDTKERVGGSPIEVMTKDQGPLATPGLGAQRDEKRPGAEGPR